jgi:hypothetical protein
MAQELTAYVAHLENPLQGLCARDLQSVTAGRTIASCAPTNPKGLLVCVRNGGPEYLPRAAWEEVLQPGDSVVFIEYPQDRNTLRGVLQVAIAIAAAYSGNPALAIAITVGGNLALNEFLPPTQPLQPQDPQTASPTYNASLAGNVARAFDVIPKIMGRHMTFPPFASQPYGEYRDDNSQYYHALFAVGVGDHEIEQTLIDDTALNHFQDVLTANYLPPGTPPSAVNPNVVTSPEVAGQDMDTAQYIGGFAACAPRLLTDTIGVDVIASRGLGTQNGDGSISNYEVSWRIEVRPINEFGVALGPWVAFTPETRTAATSTVQRWTVQYDLGSLMRPEVRIVRLDFKDPSLYALNDLQWAGLRAYLTGSADLDPETAHYELVLRGSKQLSSVSQGRFAVIAKALCPTLNSSLERQPAVHTRNPAWWCLEIATSTTWGLGLPDSRVDLQSFYDFAVTCDARQDRVDYVLDSSTSAWDAMQLVARCGRARVFRRGAVLSITRDAVATAGVTAFMPSNVQPGSMRTRERLPQLDGPDGFIVEYFDNRRWAYQSVECPMPGVTTMAAPERIRLPGITGPTHAQREGLYEAAVALYRTRNVVAVSEMQALVPAFGSPVRWLADTVDAGQSGDVVDYDSDTLQVQLSERPDWSQGNLYLCFVRDDCSLTAPLLVAPGPSDDTIILSSEPAFVPVVEFGDRERTKYLLAPLVADGDMLVKVTAVEDGGVTEQGAQLYRVSAVVDDVRVHTVDNALLPGPGEVQDPVDPGEDTGGGGGELLIVNLPNLLLFGVGGTFVTYVTLVLANDGHFYYTSSAFPSTPQYLPNAWIYTAPVELADAALYEGRLRITSASGAPVQSGDATDTWLGLDVTRSWTTTQSMDGEVVTAVLEIREISTGIIQATSNIEISLGTGVGDGG